MAYMKDMNWMIIILIAVAIGAVILAIYERRTQRTITFDEPKDVAQLAQARENAIRGEVYVAPPPNNTGGIF